MQKALTVFHEDRKILFLPEGKALEAPEECMFYEEIEWEGIMHFIQSDKACLCYVTKHPERLFRQFATLFENIDAAGGVVTNTDGALLFIFRNGRWDLPKGKMEMGETPEYAAIREVEEECGLSGVRILRSLPPTYHIFPLEDDQWALKKTRWYHMKIDGKPGLKPQTEEGITRAVWKQPDELSEVIQSTYGNLRELINEWR
ncbi:MAG: NUDIX domain-containing protein [Bacteroidales bacterium]